MLKNNPCWFSPYNLLLSQPYNMLLASEFKTTVISHYFWIITQVNLYGNCFWWMIAGSRSVRMSVEETVISAALMNFSSEIHYHWAGLVSGPEKWFLLQSVPLALSWISICKGLLQTYFYLFSVFVFFFLKVESTFVSLSIPLCFPFVECVRNSGRNTWLYFWLCKSE